MLPILDNYQTGFRRVLEHLDFLLRVFDRIHSIICALYLLSVCSLALSSHVHNYVQPHDWTLHIKEPSMQTIPVPQVDGRHSKSTPSFVSLVVGFDSTFPEVSDLAVTVLAESDVNQKITVCVIRFKIGSCLRCSPVADVICEQRWGVPAAECTSAL